MKKAILLSALLLFGVACTDPELPGTTTTTTAVGSTTITNPTTTTTESPTTTTMASTTTTTKPPVLVYEGIYPFSNGVQADAASDAWEDPVYTARRFLVDYVGFTRLIMGKFLQGDNRSGEVTATTRVNGFVTTVFVRKIGTGNNWTVIGASSPNIQVTSPTPGQRIDSPVQIRGQGIAFEGTFLGEIRQDGQYNKDGELGFGVVMGHGTEVAPFSGDIHFAPNEHASGAVLVYTDSAEDGHIQEVTATKVLF
jgi:Immunoglobulin-like domain of bacterial spore germination